MGRISIICIVVFWSWSTMGQEKTPFATYDFSSDQGYLEKRSTLEKESSTSEAYNTLIRWAIKHKDFETAIQYYAKLLELEPNNAEYHYRLAGVNGNKFSESTPIRSNPHPNSNGTCSDLYQVTRLPGWKP